MPSLPISKGFNPEKQLFGKSRLIAFGHRSRFLTGLALTEPCALKKGPLDYACGDGADGRTLVVSVPVETWPVLLVKQAARILAGRRGMQDYAYTSRYTVAEYLRSMFPGVEQHIERPVHRDPDGLLCHSHKGFNWRRIRDEIARRFRIRQVAGSPFRGLPPGMGSQVWFVAEKARL